MIVHCNSFEQNLVSGRRERERGGVAAAEGEYLREESNCSWKSSYYKTACCLVRCTTLC